MLKMAYDLNSCFYDPLHSTLGFRSSGNRNITISIHDGIVDLYAPPDWNGAESVYFIASSGSKSARTNRITLTVLPLPECGDGKCETGETCSGCSTDCGACKKKSSGGGGGGGGGSLIPYPDRSAIGKQTENKSDNESENETADAVVVAPVEQEQVQQQVASEKPAPVKEQQPDQLETAPAITGNVIQEPAKAPGSPFNPAALLIPLVTISLIVMAVKLNPMKRPSVIAETAGESCVAPSDQTYYEQLESYVACACKAGHPKSRVESELLSVGWPEEMVSKVLEQHHQDFVIKELEFAGLASHHGKALYDYILAALKNGYQKETIIDELSGVGWKQDIISNFFRAYTLN